MEDKKPIISVQNLKASYDTKVILENLSFDIYQGEIFVVAGVSGGGKTTLFRCMLGLHSDASGSITIEGDDILNSSYAKKREILRKIGIAYQSNALFGSMTLLENVMFPLEEQSLLPKDAIKKIAQNKISLVGLNEYCNYMPAELSGGMQKRAAIARAIAFEPKVVFLDEPSAGLDPIISAQIDALIMSLAKNLNITFVIVSHDLASIYNICERLILIDKGKIIAMGNPKELQKSHDNAFVRNFLNPIKI